MLSPIMSRTSAMATPAMSTTSTISAFTTIGVAEAGVATMIYLIVLLSEYEILFASKLWNKHMAQSLNLAISAAGRNLSRDRGL